MKTLSNPKFENISYGVGDGLPIIKSIWEKIGFSYLFLSIDKHSGLAPWKFVFAYISSLIVNNSSVNKIAEHCSTTPILEEIIDKKVIWQKDAFSCWHAWIQNKDKAVQAKFTKLELAKDMLVSLRKITDSRLWVAMDRRFLCKDLFQWLTFNNFDWVTKCKRNTALYELSGYDWNNKSRYSPVKPAILIARVYQKLIKSGKG